MWQKCIDYNFLTDVVLAPMIERALLNNMNTTPITASTPNTNAPCPKRKVWISLQSVPMAVVAAVKSRIAVG